MKFLFIPLFLFTFNALACDKKVDNSKVMLFVDTNFSDLEVETAKKAACQRGEKLVIVPKTYKQYTDKIRQIDGFIKQLQRCKSNCSELSKKYAEAATELSNERMSEGTITKLIENELIEIRKDGGKLSNFILSGHDGGGQFGGHKGSTSREELKELLGKYEDINDVSTLMLLGCYTGVQKEISRWKGIFPKVRMIAGYDGSAPLSDKPMGHHYLEDLLIKEKDLLKRSDEKELNQYVRQNIRGLHSMYSAVYLAPECEEDNGESTKKGMYYGSLTTKTFRSVDIDECKKKEANLKEIEKKFKAFDEGLSPLPSSPSDPAIKSLYDQARSLEHCIDELDLDMDVNALFNLRFYEAVKDNYIRFYEKDLQRAEEDLNSFNADDAIKKLDEEILSIEKTSDEEEKDFALLEKNPKAYLDTIPAKKEALKKELETLKKNPLYSQIKNIDLGNMSVPQEVIELKKAIDHNAKKSNILSIKEDQIKKNDISSIKLNVARIYNIDRFAKVLSRQSLQDLKDKKILIPTAANLKKMNRKEFKDNLHRTHAILASNSIPKKLRDALTFSAESQSLHLQHFQNPFEWHESTAQVATPRERINYGASPISTMGPIFGGTGGRANYSLEENGRGMQLGSPSRINLNQ